MILGDPAKLSMSLAQKKADKHITAAVCSWWVFCRKCLRMAGAARSAFCGLGEDAEIMFSTSISLLVASTLITANLLT